MKKIHFCPEQLLMDILISMVISCPPLTSTSVLEPDYLA